MADDWKNAIITPLQKQNVNKRECKTTEGLIYQVLNSDQKHVRHDCEKKLLANIAQLYSKQEVRQTDI